MDCLCTNNCNASLNQSEVKLILEKAVVPEHSVLFMQAMSGGTAFMAGPYLFIVSNKLLMAVGYPVTGSYDPEGFDKAIKEAQKQTRARDCIAISPSIPARLRPYLQEIDQYYILPAKNAIPKGMERFTKRAAASLRVEEDKEFTPAHKRLWAEFVGRTPLAPNVRRLYEGTESLFPDNSKLILLNAWDENNELAACLLLDLAPGSFLSYILGAHSKNNYTPYAADLLFKEMISIARREGKDYIHLGLGVNKGIKRFKTKWGGFPSLPYQMAVWEEDVPLSGKELLQIMAPVQGQPMSKQQLFMEKMSNERPFKMLWEIEKNDKQSWIGGSAHFFRYSFDSSFRKLFEKVDTVIFEGPLDQVSLDQVNSLGKNPEPNTPRIIDYLNEKEIRSLERAVIGLPNLWKGLLNSKNPDIPDVPYYLSKTRPWMAFFSIWSSFLRRNGWHQSVDLEAWQIAREMNKIVFGMEIISEQIDTLESIPVQRIVNFFKECHRWKAYIKQHEDAYLKGNLTKMMGTSAEFPSRTEMVINRRDEIFLHRMLPYIEKGRCAVFVGSAHMLNLEKMISDAGFKIEKCKNIP
ncbi:TraB/GumN family protein [Desulfitibacter alkalitolerans]|uniref:TraB/GumN family protein n=1 Tax=Desulfitibacter alkalitolerans TaxID=264641 RepID=UPI001A9A308E|nr:TraB/GumN family protein [Desulfitibacter alkalitolerans]